MSLDLFFNLANAYDLPFWIAMILFPNGRVTKKVMGSYYFLLPLIGIYIYFLVASFDPQAVATLANPRLPDAVKFFSEDAAVGSAWVHFLAMDVFAGRWIYWQGQEKKVWTAHSLFLCLALGPVGLLSHFITVALFSNNNDDGDGDDKKPNPET